jgi:hypothetical protein
MTVLLRPPDQIYKDHSTLESIGNWQLAKCVERKSQVDPFRAIHCGLCVKYFFTGIPKPWEKGREGNNRTDEQKNG